MSAMSRVYTIKAEDLTLKQIRMLMKMNDTLKDIQYPRKLQDWNIDGMIVPMNDKIAKEIGYKGDIYIR